MPQTSVRVFHSLKRRYAVVAKAEEQRLWSVAKQEGAEQVVEHADVGVNQPGCGFHIKRESKRRKQRRFMWETLGELTSS